MVLFVLPSDDTIPQYINSKYRRTNLPMTVTKNDYSGLGCEHGSVLTLSSSLQLFIFFVCVEIMSKEHELVKVS